MLKLFPMNKLMKNTSHSFTLEEFCNILEMLKSKDIECNILAKELLRPFVYEIDGNKICLTKDFSFEHKYNGCFK